MTRKQNDFYETHPRLTNILVDHIERHPDRAVAIKDRGTTVFEPCAGDLAIAKVLKQRGAMIVQTNDIDEARPTEYHFDATSLYGWVAALGGTQYDWIITNAPFTSAAEILPNAWRYARVGLACLLRLTFLEPTRNRAVWLESMAPYLEQLIVFSQPRPAFALNKHGKPGTDSVTTAWFVWLKGKRVTTGTDLYFETEWQ